MSCGDSQSIGPGDVYEVTSPEYPENYPDNADCTYTISQPTGTVILLTILSMDIEYYSDYYDYFSSSDYYTPCKNVDSYQNSIKFRQCSTQCTIIL